MKEKHIIVPYLDESYMYEYLDEGVNGACYRTKSGEVFKKFHSPIADYKDFIRLVGINSEFFVFPEKTVYLEEYGEEFLLGYIMEYILGTKFSELPVSVNIRDLFGKLDLAEKEILYLTQEENIELFDMHEDNTFLLPNGDIRFLDNDLASVNYDDPYVKYKRNLRELGLFILGFFLKEYKIKSDKIREYYERCIYTGKMKPSYVLFEVLQEMENESKESINTFGDFYRAKKLLLK